MSVTACGFVPGGILGHGLNAVADVIGQSCGQFRDGRPKDETAIPAGLHRRYRLYTSASDDARKKQRKRQRP